MQNNAYYFNCDDVNNNILMLDDKTIIRVLNIVQKQTNDIYIIRRKFNIVSSIYEKPCSSTILSIFIVSENNTLYYWSVKQVICKMWTIKKTKNKCIVVPLRHDKN